MTTKMNYEAWLREVDAICWSIADLSLSDVDDYEAWLREVDANWYEDDISPGRAAKRAIRNAGG